MKGARPLKDRAQAVDLLLRALEAGADFVDVELGLPREMRRVLFREAGPHRVILSRHETWGTPSGEALISLLTSMAEENPGLVKIVCLARFPGDTLRVLSLITRARALGVGVSAFCMGAVGMLSRVLFPSTGGDPGLCLTGRARQDGCGPDPDPAHAAHDR